ncbi:dihydrofolate reductase family protein [Larkinella bovis]|uniref:Dihydrofolate reductase family protein n=1 Tax=Larkinella bovis TaxID=683041 RepID=A0ABW0I557_9BACT
MRKVILQMQLSLDGFAAGLRGEQDWMVWNWDKVLKQYADDIAASADTMFIGRITYEGMANYWPSAATNPEASPDEIAFAQKMNALEKIVFSRTLLPVNWQNSRLANRPVEEEVAALKQQPGKNLVIYGGTRLVSSFIRHGLIDEFHLFVNPVILGKGMPIWQEITNPTALKLVKTTTSSVGITILCYQSE